MRRWLVAILLGTGLALQGTVLALAQDMSGGGATAVAPAGDGGKVYEEICQACHMANAEGAPANGVPALAHNAKLADPEYPVRLLLKGRGGMPPFTDILTQAEMAAVVTYVRSHFNGYPEPVTEADVKRVAANSKPK